MADKKPSVFRFRLPWLQQATPPTPAPEPSTQSPPRTTPQAAAQRPPFRPPGKAAPPVVATPPPPQSVPKSPIIETIRPDATQPSEDNQTITKTVQTTETTSSAKETGIATPPKSPPRLAQSPPSSPTRSPRTPPRVRVSPRPVSPEATPSRETSQPPSPPQTPPQTPPKLPISPPSTPEIKRSTEKTKLNGTQTRSMNAPNSMETKSQKPKPITATLPREIKDDISKFIHKITTTTNNSKESINGQPGSVITISGDNKGAFMHLNSDEVKRDTKPDSKPGENEEAKTIVNSNVQGINNSIMFDSSVTKRNPGVHLVITRNILDAKMKNNVESMEMQRAEFNISSPQKVIYDPAVVRSLQDDYEADDFETSASSYEIEVL